MTAEGPLFHPTVQSDQDQQVDGAAPVFGRIHSVETCGAVDGPGLRYVLFLSGCPLRCLYCHNCDTWDPASGRSQSVDEVMADIRRYRSYFRASGGGVTLSGGEPAMQAGFVAALFRACRQEGIPTCLDTSGYCDREAAERFLPYTDLVLLDIKQFDPIRHRQLTGVANDKPLAFAQLLAEREIPVWVRHVLVPGYTDRDEDLDDLCRFAASLGNVRRLTFLPFHSLGSEKRRELGIDDPLADVVPPGAEEMERARQMARRYGLDVD
ncbi:pyruvate formate lyase-activating protein [Heliobacterium gestii]|uniref:Pyruvate formate-lyase-activating enzyme n=1 Tax=Heliomicrobium gestii TaxID=2699 RepID=A0A845L8T5_HELGE|nr:pyruvate formate-lyase-activating protein [Heliomicrobium gestii]MBM7866054.1 pyruvate formate lyase activating enzyme [Heliomicrobium gestii]MZP42618.1 pyruvate formate lyase-activating protein [Heliomicrobium gestii]